VPTKQKWRLPTRPATVVVATAAVRLVMLLSSCGHPHALAAVVGRRGLGRVGWAGWMPRAKAGGEAARVHNI
jgi:hypothetical protein